MTGTSSNSDRRFVCNGCGTGVSRLSYRATCPDCGDSLRSVPPGVH